MNVHEVNERLAEIRREHGNDKTTGGALIRMEMVIEPFIAAVDKELNDKEMLFPDTMEAYVMVLASSIWALSQQLDEDDATKHKFIQQTLAKIYANTQKVE